MITVKVNRDNPSLMYWRDVPAGRAVRSTENSRYTYIKPVTPTSVVGFGFSDTAPHNFSVMNPPADDRPIFYEVVVEITVSGIWA